MIVSLNNVGNIDHGQDPDKKLYGTNTGWVECSNFKEASKVVRDYIEQYNLGGGNFTGGDILDKTTKK